MKVHFNKIWRENNQYISEYHTKRKGFLFSKPVHIRFISKYPHYVLHDIIWMLKCTDKQKAFSDYIYKATDKWTEELDIQIGTLKFKTAKKADFSSYILKEAVKEQGRLEKEWSDETGKDYPDLEMPKRSMI